MAKLLQEIADSLSEIKGQLLKLNLGVYGDPINKNLGLLDSNRNHANKIAELEVFKKKIEEAKIIDKVEKHEKLILKLMYGIAGGVIVIIFITERKAIFELISKMLL